MSAAAVQQLNGLKNEYSLLVEKLQEMEMEAEEHAVVLGALKPLDGARKCHRMVGGVLVERSVAEVIPALQKNHAGVWTPGATVCLTSAPRSYRPLRG